MGTGTGQCTAEGFCHVRDDARNQYRVQTLLDHHGHVMNTLDEEHFHTSFTVLKLGQIKCERRFCGSSLDGLL